MMIMLCLAYRVNFWGYSTINFFSPMIRYSSAGIKNCGRDGINEIKFLIKEAHKRGIEVTRISLIVFCFFLFFLKLNYDFITVLLCRLSWMLFSIIQLKGMRMAPLFLSEVLTTVSITC